MAYGNGWSAATGGDWYGTGEHETSANQKQGWANQAAWSQQRATSDMEQQREMHERALQNQEQARRSYDSQTARSLGQQKFGVLSSLLGGARTGMYS